MPGPLTGLRIVVTIPPHVWFGGVDYDFAVEMSEELRTLGAEVFDLEIAGFHSGNANYIAGAIEGLKAFRPDVALPLPNALYALLCVTREGRNILTDVLQIPTVMLWDHGLLQLPRQILKHQPSIPAEAQGDAVRRLRKVMNHALYCHYSPDRGHVAALDQLGVVEASKVHFFLQPAYPNFVRHGYRPPGSNAFRTRVAFAGNVYLQASKDLPFRNQPVLAGIESRVLAAKKARLTECLWDLFLTEIQALDKPARKELRLEPDSTFFWNFVHEEIELVGNTDVRLAVLTGLKREFEFYGNFVEPKSTETLLGQYRIQFRKCLDYFTELPLLFMNSDVIVDVINLGYNSGISPKVMGCFACGGFVLFDYKDDFRKTIGDVANQVMYRSVDHLNTLVDEYLTDARKRRDVSRYLQHRIATEFSFAALAKHILVDKPVWRR
uniref:Spore protein YkvP/CgeB glycosyl transferase-like domain-containing protein n=1 Tax=Solibacter usitatus (strain Ellin6076) TaxID=234267 RepID=Q02BJ8_SOLUE